VNEEEVARCITTANFEEVINLLEKATGHAKDPVTMVRTITLLISYL
jgi:hypothetical protein